MLKPILTKVASRKSEKKPSVDGKPGDTGKGVSEHPFEGIRNGRMKKCSARVP
jgi:hypothetical protein